MLHSIPPNSPPCNPNCLKIYTWTAGIFRVLHAKFYWNRLINKATVRNYIYLKNQIFWPACSRKLPKWPFWPLHTQKNTQEAPKHVFWYSSINVMASGQDIFLNNSFYTLFYGKTSNFTTIICLKSCLQSEVKKALRLD